MGRSSRAASSPSRDAQRCSQAACRGGDHEPGQATVELAITLPLLVGVAALVAQVGLVSADRVALEHAAHDAARAAAAANVPDGDVARVARAAALARLDDPELAVDAGSDGARVSVTLTLQRAVGLAPLLPLRHAVVLSTTASAPREPASAGAE